MFRHRSAVLEFVLPPVLPVTGAAHFLRRGAVQRLYLAFTVAACFHLAAATLFLFRWSVEHVAPRRVVIINPGAMIEPPPLTTQPQAPMQAPDVIAPSSIGVPEPVEDFRAPAMTLPDNATLARAIDDADLTNLRRGVGDSVVIQLPPAQVDRSPGPGDFVAFEEPPELISVPAPVYPEMARGAELEGTVRVLALVGKDGKVKQVRTDDDLPMLREAALAAARQAAFRPALQQHRPVEVWVQIPMRFTLH
jgi:TonB family protein